VPNLVGERHTGKGKCLTGAAARPVHSFPSLDPPSTGIAMSERRRTQPASRRIRVSGHVQGVGFRPHVFRLAAEFGLTGWVQNQLGEVEILAQGPTAALDSFQRELLARAPALSHPSIDSVENSADPLADGFCIIDSAADRDADIHVPPDYFTCDECVAELGDPADRRFRYPFINCTQCGPRYTLIRSMPYDRPNTSMAEFPLCGPCRSEYENPADRRFHAEPVACPTCGPELSYRHGQQAVKGNEPSLTASIAALRAGHVIAVKGVGGYHLMCNACDDAPIQRLRAAKPRPDKPLAVMFPVRGDDGLDLVRREVHPRETEMALLACPARPIVLMDKRADGNLSDLVAPGLNEIGVMLPYSPLHHLLASGFGGPLIATSGNVSGEPVLTEVDEVEHRIDRVVDGYLHHDRPIVRPADDSVFRRLAGRNRPIRLGRGTAPIELQIQPPLGKPVLAVGGHMKNTIALGWGHRAVISPHIGDMDTARSVAIFEQVVADLQSLYGIRAEAVIADAHPDYATTRWAQKSGLPVFLVPHHYAHASAAARAWPAGENGIVFAWDGVGYGPDGTLWGGETLIGRPGDWRRAGHLRSFRLPGGDRAGREPWRSAAAVCWETGREWQPPIDMDWGLARAAWKRQMNAPVTTAAGRLFDAAAALAGLVYRASFEGQGPMLLEALAEFDDARPVSLPLARSADGWVTDWEPLVDLMLDDQVSVARRSGRFHAALAAAVADQAEAIRKETGASRVALTGGVFQNRLLTELSLAALQARGMSVDLDDVLPVNDGGLSAGQIVEYAACQSVSAQT